MGQEPIEAIRPMGARDIPARFGIAAPPLRTEVVRRSVPARDPHREDPVLIEHSADVVAVVVEDLDIEFLALRSFGRETPLDPERRPRAQPRRRERPHLPLDDATGTVEFFPGRLASQITEVIDATGLKTPLGTDEYGARIRIRPRLNSPVESEPPQDIAIDRTKHDLAQSLLVRLPANPTHNGSQGAYQIVAPAVTRADSPIHLGRLHERKKISFRND